MPKSIYFSILFTVLLIGCDRFSKTESGLNYKILSRGVNSQLPSVGEYVQCHISIANQDDSVFYSTFGKTPERILISDFTHKGGDIMEALQILSEGDSAKILISADSFYFKTRRETMLPSYIKKGSMLTFLIKMDRKLNQYQVDSLINSEKIERWNKEIKDITKYCNKNNLEVKIDTATGLRYQFHQKGADTAQRIVEGKIVTFHFIGKLMDGTEFFNSYTSGQKQTIRVVKGNLNPIGLYEVLIKMREGEKATFIMPYDLAYGARGVEGIVPPFSTLVYEINILKVQ